MNSIFEVSGSIEIATFEGAFDLLQVGVMFVDHDCKIIHVAAPIGRVTPA